MRSTRFSFPFRVLLALPALGAGAAAGCGTEVASSFSDRPATLQDQGATDGFPETPVGDAAPPTPPYRGNPLCHAESNTCMPDDDGYHRSVANLECATASPDAGDAGAAGSTGKGCRIARDPKTASMAPSCLSANATGGDGTSCAIGEECAPGLDCVAGEMGSKLCRHYCCGGTCKGNPSNGSATFCDVQNLVDVPQRAPVCMPLKRCSKLLVPGECAANESCTVVTESGDTGCLLVGDKQVGESCDEAHCAVKLACLGQPGARKCFKLCKVASSDCPATQTCVTSASFKDPSFGICQ